ncbi:MAG: hypothetical protein ACOX0O_00660 [Candidatus Methanoculleus thermohydrogenotrophicum]
MKQNTAGHSLALFEVVPDRAKHHPGSGRIGLRRSCPHGVALIPRDEEDQVLPGLIPPWAGTLM